MSKVFGQLSDSPRGERPALSVPPASGVKSQLELELPGLAPPAQPPARAPRARRPAALPAPVEPAAPSGPSEPAGLQAALVQAEATAASLRSEVAAERAARLQAQADLQALKVDAAARMEQAEAEAAKARHALDAQRASSLPARSLTRPAVAGMPVSRRPVRRTIPRGVRIAAVILLVIGTGAWLLGRRPSRPAPVTQAGPDRRAEAAPADRSAPAFGDAEPAGRLARSPTEPGPAPSQIEGSEPARANSLPIIEIEGLRARPEGDGLLIVFDQGLFSRHASLSDDARALLKQLSGRLRPALSGWRLEITGHTDPDPVRSERFADNQELAYRRAQAVADCLMSECSLWPGALAVFSAGESNAPYPNTTPDLRRKNRTVTIRLAPR